MCRAIFLLGSMRDPTLPFDGCPRQNKIYQTTSTCETGGPCHVRVRMTPDCTVEALCLSSLAAITGRWKQLPLRRQEPRDFDNRVVHRHRYATASRDRRLTRVGSSDAAAGKGRKMSDTRQDQSDVFCSVAFAEKTGQLTRRKVVVMSSERHTSYAPCAISSGNPGPGMVPLCSRCTGTLQQCPPATRRCGWVSWRCTHATGAIQVLTPTNTQEGEQQSPPNPLRPA